MYCTGGQAEVHPCSLSPFYTVYYRQIHVIVLTYDSSILSYDSFAHMVLLSCSLIHFQVGEVTVCYIPSIGNVAHFCTLVQECFLVNLRYGGLVADASQAS